VVLIIGETEVLPVDSTVPMPWSILTILAFETLQMSVEKDPEVILFGSAIKELMTGRESPCPGKVMTIVPPQPPTAKPNMAINKPAKMSHLYLFMLTFP